MMVGIMLPQDTSCTLPLQVLNKNEELNIK
jgi:hypothetical protein